jgi:hypothetical protein
MFSLNVECLKNYNVFFKAFKMQNDSREFPALKAHLNSILNIFSDNKKIISLINLNDKRELNEPKGIR